MKEAIAAVALAGAVTMLAAGCGQSSGSHPTTYSGPQQMFAKLQRAGFACVNQDNQLPHAYFSGRVLECRHDQPGSPTAYVDLITYGSQAQERDLKAKIAADGHTYWGDGWEVTGISGATLARVASILKQ
jgi:hypothetical protein